MIYFVAASCLIVGLIAGFFIGMIFFRKQMEKMQNDPKLIQDMAKKMGYNVNRKQVNQVQQMMRKRSRR